MSIADRPLVFLRPDTDEALQRFAGTFGEDFEIAAFRCDEATIEALANSAFTPAALFVLLNNPSARTELPLLAKVSLSHPHMLKILLGDGIPLSLLVNLLDRGQIDRCFEQPVNADLIRSHVLRAALAVPKVSVPSIQLAAATSNDRPAVLIVDDEPTATRYLARQLEHLQSEFEVLCADNAEAALELMHDRGDRIAAIMTDQRMPGMQGKELLDELKHSHACTVRILTSAYGEMAVAMDAVNDGEIFRYQKKPWRAGDCLPLFQEALARHRWLVNERARVQADLKHQFETLYSGRIKRLDVLQSVVSETAGRPVLMDFIQALQRIQPLPANASHLRASLATDLEQLLIDQFCELAGQRLTHLRRLPAGPVLDSTTFRSVLQAIADAGDEASEPTTVAACLAEAFTILLTASGQNWHHVDFAGVDAEKGMAQACLHMYTHLLAPLSRVSRPLIEQQVAFLLLHIASARLGCQLHIEGGQQRYMMTLRLPDSLETC